LVFALMIYVVSESAVFVIAILLDTHMAFFEAGDFCKFRSLHGRPSAGIAMVSC
jgi:hypothetical protein